MLATSSCPSPEALRRYSLGQYSDQEGRDIEEHLSSCSSCEDSLSGFDDASDSLLRHLPLTGQPLTVDERTGWLKRLLTLPFDRESRLFDQMDSPSNTQATSHLFAMYEFDGVLGKGGMGVVYAGKHRQLGKQVAIKVVSPRLVAAEDARRRFDREIQILGSLNHPGIVSATDAGKVAGAAFLVMERIEGADLASLVRNSGPLTVDEASAVAEKVAEALAAAHEAGAIHRDVKPSNVMVDRHGRVKLLDFGLAHLTERIDSHHQTSLGNFLGTFDFMAPEQASGDEIDQSTDLYGLGATLFSLLTGRCPRDIDRQSPLIRQIRDVSEKPARPLTDFRNDVPLALEELITRLLSIDRTKRPGSAEEVAAELRSLTGNKSSIALRELGARVKVHEPSCQSEDELAYSLSEILGSDSGRPDSTTELDGVASTQKDRSSIWWWIPAILATAALLGFAGFKILLQTENGTIQIESEQAGVTVEFVDEQDQVTPLKVETKFGQTQLRAGQYRVRLAGQHDALTITPDQIVLSKGGTELARVTMIDSDKQPPEEEQVASVARQFWRALIENRRDEAMSMLSPDHSSRIAAQGMWDDASSSLANQEVVTPKVLVAGDKALAQFPEISLGAEGSQQKLVPGVVLSRREGKWGVSDMDAISPENAAAEWKRMSGTAPDSDLKPVVRVPESETTSLYQGNPYEVWNRRFESETNPVARIEAAKALITLAEGDSDATRVNRVLTIGGALVGDGWRVDPVAFIERAGTDSFAPSRWSKTGFKDLKNTWLSFLSQCVSVVRSVPPTMVAEQFSSVLQSDKKRLSALFTLKLLGENAIQSHLAMDPKVVDQIIGLSLPVKDRMAFHLAIAQSDFWSSVSTDAKDKFVQFYSDLGEHITVLQVWDDELYDLAEDWQSKRIRRQIPVDKKLVSRMALKMILQRPFPAMDNVFAASPLGDNIEPYRVSALREASEKDPLLWQEWTSQVTEWLKDNEETDQRSHVILSTLNKSLRLRRADQPLSGEELALLLNRRLRRADESGEPPKRYGAPSRAQFLSLIVLVTGELPDQPVTPNPVWDSMLAKFRKFLISPTDTRTYYESLRDLRGLYSHRPIEVIRAVIESKSLVRGSSPISVVASAHDLGQNSALRVKVDSLLVVAALAQMSGQSEEFDDRISEFFSRDPHVFRTHLHSQLYSEFAASRMIASFLQRMRSRTNSPALMEAIDELMPGPTWDVAVQAINHPNSLAAVLHNYNTQTLRFRRKQFDPPIADLELSELVDGFRGAAERYRKVGDGRIARALEAAAESGFLPPELENHGGVTGVSSPPDETGESTYRQLIPAIHYITGPDTRKLVVLRDVELRWSRDGWSSPDWGAVDAPVSGVWRLTTVSQEGEALNEPLFEKWCTSNLSWTRVEIQKNREFSLLGAPSKKTFELDLDYESPARFRLLGDGKTEFEGFFMTNAMVDDTKLSLTFDLGGGPTEANIKPDDSRLIKLSFERVGPRPVAEQLQDAVD